MSSDGENKKSADLNWYKQVWKVVSEIPPGHVLTYGEVARLSGLPAAARRVSQALRRAPKGLRSAVAQGHQLAGKNLLSRGFQRLEKSERPA